jgi:hypothetical protein
VDLPEIVTRLAREVLPQSLGIDGTGVRLPDGPVYSVFEVL